MDRVYKEICMAVWAVSTLVVLSACSNEPAPPPPPKQRTDNSFEKGVAGGSTTTTVEVQARVMAVDRQKRRVTLMGSDGKRFDVSVDPGTADLSRVEKGDLVKVTLSRRLDVTVVSADESLRQAPVSLLVLSSSKQKAGGVLADRKTLEARVVAIDKRKRTATLEMPDGKRETFPVRPDIDLSRYHIGDRVGLRFTKAVTIELIKAAQP